MEVRILGPLEVVHDARPVGLGGPRDRALLTLLVAHVGEVVSSDRLIEAMWGDRLPRDSQHALQAAVSRIRKSLEDAGAPNVIVTRPPGYVLDLEPEDVDAARFDRLIERARRHEDPGTRAAALQEALVLWRGPPLADVAYEDWAQPEISRLEEVRLGAVEDEIDALLTVGRHHEVLGRLGTLVEEHPWREVLRRQLMLALYRSGRQAEALEAYEQTRVAMVEELGAEPGPELRRLHEHILGQDPSLDWCPPPPTRTNLPEPLTGFVGREEETSQVAKLLAERRLVTLTGPGGSGKTRLAAETGRVLADRYGDGVWLVDLAPLTDSSLLPQAVAAALRVPEDPVRPLVETVVDALRDKQLLLILDNCEHLIAKAADLADTVLSAAPGVRILATSREVIGVPGETVFEVPPLPVPDRATAAARPEDLLRYDAVRLFVDRAAAAQPGFALSSDNVRPVGDIATRLEGLPLALELAAARVRGLGVDAIASRLGYHFGLLAGGRRTRLPKERSFRAAVDWSYDLLSEPERRVFERLSVFAGGYSLDAAEAVAAGEPVEAQHVPDLLARLVDRSLVQRAGSSPVRYRLLEPVRQYAAERLDSAGETNAARRRHLGFYTALAEAAEPALRGREQRTWLDRLEDEHDNLGAALAAAAELDPDAGLGLAAALGPYWRTRGHLSEGRERLRVALSTSDENAPARARALVEAGSLADFQCDYEEALTYSEAALVLYRRGGDRWGVAYALGELGLAAWEQGRPDQARACLNESLALRRDLDDRWGVAVALWYLGFVAVADGSVVEAATAYEESLAWFREQRDDSGTAMALAWLGGLAGMRGELDHAEELLRQSLELSQRIGDRWTTAWTHAHHARVAALRASHREAINLFRQALRIFVDLGDRVDSGMCLAGLADLASKRGQAQQATELFGAAESRRLGTGFSALIVDPAGYQQRIEALRSQLGDETFEHAWARGRAMTLGQAHQLALSLDNDER